MTVIKVTTAVELTKAQQSTIEKTLSQKLNEKNLDFEYIVDAKVVGGIKLTMGSRELDGTLRARLQQVRSNLSKNI